VFVFVVGFVLLYEITPKGQASKKAAKAAAQAFEKSVKEKKDLTTQGIAVKKWSVTRINFTFFGVDFSFNPIWAFCGGVVIAAALWLARARGQAKGRRRRFPVA